MPALDEAAQKHTSLTAGRCLLFAVVIVVAVLSVGRLNSFLPHLESATTGLTLLLASLFGITATYKDTLLTVDGFRMLFVSECTALHFMFLFSLAVLFTPNQKTSHRIIGIVTGIPSIILVNSTRLVLLGVVGSRATRPTFSIIHDFVFQILMSILVLAMWFIWSEQKANSKRTTWCIAAITFSALYLIVAAALGDSYLAAVAYAANKLFTAAGLVDTAAAMINGTFSYLIKWQTYTISYRQDVISIALLWGLFSASMWQEMASRSMNTRPLLKTVIAGTLILVMLQLAECVCVGVFLRQGVNVASVVEYLLYLRFLFIGLPVLMWWRAEERHASARINTLCQSG